MITNCEACSIEIEAGDVDQCLTCGQDGLCSDCIGDHECEDDYDDE